MQCFSFPNFYHYLTKICAIFCFSRVSPTNLAKLLEKIAKFSMKKKKKKKKKNKQTNKQTNPWQIFLFLGV
jgi:uncharacterized membrane protein YadS